MSHLFYFSSLLLQPATSTGVDDIAVFNNEQRIAVTTPPPSEKDTDNLPDEHQPSQALVPANNDDQLFEEADMIYLPSEESMKQSEEK